jgi:SAM-dependent methyltransferase
MAEWWKDFFDADYIKVYKNRDQVAGAEANFVRKTLGLRRGQRVLDVCCGYGRHALPLARAGLRVTGFDQSRFFLRKAGRDARKNKLPIEWIEGDVREMEFEPIFDAAINMFTSFGFFPTEEENFQLIRRSTQALKPGGRFLLDTINRDQIIRHFQPRFWQPLGKGLLVDRREMDWRTGTMHNTRTLVYPGGRRRRQEFSLRLHTLVELTALFERAGLAVTQTLGSYDGAPYGPDTLRMIVVGRKPKR